MDFGSFISILLFISFVIPPITRRLLEARRYSSIHALERKRGTRLIALIHRQESISFLGIPLSRYIDIQDSEEILRAIRLTPPDVPIDLVVHTPGGLVLAAEQIAHALVRHKAKVSVLVPHYAMSGGTLLALAADEIVMDPNAVLGPVDPQLGEYPAASLVDLLETKNPDQLEDRTLIFIDVARKALRQVHATVVEILAANGMPEERATELADVLSTGRFTHDYPIAFEEARLMGLPVADSLPTEVYDLMSLYPQVGNRRPSVRYIPFPYRRDDQRRERGG